ncbi:MAG: OmpH family outer membrane protein [Chthoniobacterales bacterium]
MSDPHSNLHRAILLSALLLSSLIAHVTQAELTIGTVDMNRILKEYRKTREAEAKLNEAKDAAKKEFDERADAYKKGLEEINALNAQLESPALTAEAKAQKSRQRDEKIAKLKEMEREINEFRQTREQQLRQQVQQLQENLIKEITAVVLEQAKAKNLDLVFDTSGASLNQFSPILFSKERADFSGEVIAALNKTPVAAAKPSAPSKP